VPLGHINRIPDGVIAWVQDKLIEKIEGANESWIRDKLPEFLDKDSDFPDRLRAWLTAQRSTDEWSALNTRTGLPLGVKFRGEMYPASLRVKASFIGPGTTDLEKPPQIQRWAFGISELGNTMISADLRSANLALRKVFDTPEKYKNLWHWFLAPHLTLVYGQLSSQVTATQTNQPMRLIRSKGPSELFHYALEWEVRLGNPLDELFKGKIPDDNWEPLTDAPPTVRLDPLSVWFPKYLAAPGPLPKQDPNDPSTVPAPMELLAQHTPHSGVVTFPNYDQVLADLAASFPTVPALAYKSREQLRRWLSEGGIRSKHENGLNAVVSSPILYDRLGRLVGYFRYFGKAEDRKVKDGDKEITEITGPITDKVVLESHTLRSHKVAGISTVTNSLGAQLQGGVEISEADKNQYLNPASSQTQISSGTVESSQQTMPATGEIAYQPGYQHTFAHALGSGGSSRVSSSLRSAVPLFDVTPDLTLHFELVRPIGDPLRPADGTPLSGGKKYPVNMLVPSMATVLGRPATPRYPPPEILYLTYIPLTVTVLEVSGGIEMDEFWSKAEELLRGRGFLPSEKASHKIAHEALLFNQAQFDEFKSNMGKRNEMRESVDGGAHIWLQHGFERIRLEFKTERRFPKDRHGRPDTSRPNEGVVHERALDDLPTLNYAGSTLPGDEQFIRTPAGVTTAFLGEYNSQEGPGRDVVMKEVVPEVVRSFQKSWITDSSAGTQHEDYILTPVSQGSRTFGIPTVHTLTFTDSEGILGEKPVKPILTDENGQIVTDEEGNPREGEPEPLKVEGMVRLAIPTFQTLSEPATGPPPEVTIRALRAEDEAALKKPNSAATGPSAASEDATKAPSRVPPLWDGEYLRLPQGAYALAMPGSAKLQQGTYDLLSLGPPSPAGGDDATVADETAATDDPAPVARDGGRPPQAGDSQAQVRGSQPVSPRGITTSRSVRFALPDDEQTLAANDADPVALTEDDGESFGMPGMPGGFSGGISDQAVDLAKKFAERVKRGVKGVWEYNVGPRAVAPESMAGQVITTGLSPVYQLAHAHRTFRDSRVLEGASTTGALADRTFIIKIQAYLKDVEPLEQPPSMDAERWQQSTFVSGSAKTEVLSTGGGVTMLGEYGNFEPEGFYVGNTYNTRTQTIRDTTGVWRVITEDTSAAYQIRGTGVYVVEVTQIWWNVYKTGVNELRQYFWPVESRTDSFVVEAPGTEVMLFTNDFHAHPELLSLLPEAQRPGPPPEPDRPLPNFFVETGGVIGDGLTSAVEFADGRSALEDAITRTLKKVMGSGDPNRWAALDGVRSRINQLATGHGPQGVINAGPEGRVAFHWIHRGARHNRLVEVAVTAMPDVAKQPLPQVRGRKLSKTSGIDHIAGHISGGSELNVPGATQISQTRSWSNQAFFAPLGDLSDYIGGPSLNWTILDGRTVSTVSTHEDRGWHRSFGNANEYSIDYVFIVVVTTRLLTEAAVGLIQEKLGSALHWAGSAAKVVQFLERQGIKTTISDGSMEVVDAIAFQRFNDSETPKRGHRRVPWVAPQITGTDPVEEVAGTDPANGAPPPPQGALGINMRSDRLGGQQWRPQRPITVYYSFAIPLLREALLQADPRLHLDPAELTRSDEAINIILRDLAMAAGPVKLTDAAMTHLLGNRGREGTTVTFLLYDAQPESSSKDIAIDEIRISTSQFLPQYSRNQRRTVTIGANEPFGAAGTAGQYAGRQPSIPLLGTSRTPGVYASESTLRRDMLRFGTPMESATGDGQPGHLTRPVGVIKFTGPTGIERWVIAIAVIRTTETPPGAIPAYPDE
jgi:hypothetical protein